MIDAWAIPMLQKLSYKNEGFVAIPYIDSLGNETIGIGWCLNTTPMTLDEAMFINKSQLLRVEKEVADNIHFYYGLNNVRKCVLIDMAFNMGINGLMGFKKFLDHLSKGEWDLASQEMLNSLWAKQVGNRAERLVQMIENGDWPDGL